MKTTEKLMKFTLVICQVTKELSLQDKAIVLIVVAFLSATAEIVTGIFLLSSFLFGLLVFALFLFWSELKAIIRSVPKTPEGSAGLGFAIGMIGLVILLVIMILNR